MTKRMTGYTMRLLALALGIGLAATGWADFAKTNPVTGETENYTWKFVGTDTWNGTGNWQNSSGANPSGTPAKSGENTWDPILFDGNTININASMSVEGWNLRMGLYNGANVTMNTFVKYQGDTTMWMTVDETSQLTIGGFGGGNIIDGQVIKLSVAKANGITWNVDLTSVNANNTFEYYLKGAGSVSYQAVSAAYHKIKMADVTLTGTSQVSHKTLVSFTSSSQTFTADAAIKVLDSNGDQVATKALSTVNTTGTTTLTTDNSVGTCELVQTSTGIDLYWVDGDPANLPAATVYKPSININFTSGTALSTVADVGIGGYAIPGTSWNNLTVSDNASLSALNAADSSGATFATAASVTITGTRGSWSCSSLTAASDLRHGYIDETATATTPTVTVSGIPYEKYRVIVYTATDAADKTFGYLAINGKNYTYSNGNVIEGTAAWGASGGQDTAEPIAEGVNVMVSPVTLGSTLTVVGHRSGNDIRGCIAAVQIVEYVPEVTENDLVIPVVGASATYTVSEAKTLSGTVYVVGSGTLTLDGSAKITAATIDVAKDVVLNVNADRLDATTFTGSGTVVYNNSLPVAGKGWTDSDNWIGTVWLKNYAIAGLNPGDFANARSTLRLSLCTGYFNDGDNTKTCAGTLDLQNDTGSYAFSVANGWSNNGKTIFARLTGSGTLGVQTKDIAQRYIFKDASEFTGAINLANRTLRVIIGDGESLSPAYGSITVVAGATATVASGKTWNAEKNGFVVNGTLNVNGSITAASASNAISGSGTVVFNGKAPSPVGDTWWENNNWTGTVQIDSIDNMVGAETGYTGTYLDFNSYGNDSSVIKLGNLTGWLGNYTCNVPVNLAGTLTINNGISGDAFTFKKLISNGGYITATDQAATSRIVIEDGSEYAGYIGLNAKMVVFGTDNPSFVKGRVYVSSDATITVPAVNTAYWAVGSIVVAGELKADSLARFGGGTSINTTDNGVFTLTGSDNVNDTTTDYARITGTGTLRYAEVTGKWRTLSKTNFPTGMICENNLSSGLILQNPSETYTIGSLAGSGTMRSDMSNGNRHLRILQAKDTTYSGLFHTDDRIGTVTVAPGASTAGTLTLSNTQTVSNDLAIESGAKVNLTGTWKGATTVAGTFGGTGTLTGNLTFSDGATFKANATALTVSGTVTTPGSGSVAVDVSDIASSITSSGVTLISGGVSEVGTFAAPSGYRIAADNNALKIYPVVTVTIPDVANASATVNGDAVAGGASVQVDAGSNVTIAWTAASGYKITAGATQTINAIAENVTADAPTVAAMGATVSDVNFNYGADYATATVTATVTGDATSATLSYGGATYNANVGSGGAVTFENVAVTRGTDIYAPIAYTIAAKSGETTISTTAGSSIAADGSVWFSHDSSGLIGGNWTTAVDLAEPAEVSDNTFTPTATPSSNDVVVLEFDVCFKSVSDDDIDNEAQAAIKIGEVDSSPTFMVLTNGNSWAAVSAQGITPDPTADYKVVLTLNYTTHTYGATVNGVDLKDEQNSAVFSMAKSTDIGANSLEFRGTGTLTSMKGEKLEGNMVASLMQKYATVDDAIAAYSAGTDTGPFVVLHAGTAPAGWTITDGVSEDTLSCTAAAKTVSGGVTIYYDTLQDAIDVNALDTASLSGEPAATPTNIVLLAANTEDVTLPVDKTVVIDATTSALAYKEPVCVENGDYTFEATTNEYNVATYAARNWYEWTLTLVNANGATVTGIENGTNVTEKSPTVTFTVAPAANYHMVSVTAQPEGGEVETLTADNGTYSYTFGTNATITVNTAIDTYTVTFVDEDGTTVLKAATAYDYGTATNAIVQPETPTKAADELYTYAFAGWTPTLAEVTANAIYTATYTPVLRSYEITIPDVANTTVSVAYVTGGVAANATAAGNITVDAGTSLTATWTAASGYKITAGGTQTINPVAAAQTLASPIVEALGATVSDVNFTYGADYATATVTATVTGDATGATLSYNNSDYTATTFVNNGNGTSTATFENVAVARGNDIYAPIAYTIAAKSGETTISTTGGSSIVADGSVWFEHNSTGLIGGSWATAVDLTTPADVTDNTFTPTATPSSNDVVVLEFEVCFQSVSDEDIVDDAQAAIKIGDVNDTPAFMVLTNGNLWTAVSAQGVTPDPAATNKVVLTLNYTTHTYGATVDGVDLKDEQNSAVFSMAKSGDTGVNSLEFRGTGTLASMKGEQLDGNMVVDNNGTKYATIDAAIAAYNQDNTIGPLTMLHEGTAPSGWKIVTNDGVKILKKIAKGFVFLMF